MTKQKKLPSRLPITESSFKYVLMWMRFCADLKKNPDMVVTPDHFMEWIPFIEDCQKAGVEQGKETKP